MLIQVFSFNNVKIFHAVLAVWKEFLEVVPGFLHTGRLLTKFIKCLCGISIQAASTHISVSLERLSVPFDCDLQNTRAHVANNVETAMIQIVSLNSFSK